MFHQFERNPTGTDVHFVGGVPEEGLEPRHADYDSSRI
jgi:hypothetical protein